MLKKAIVRWVGIFSLHSVLLIAAFSCFLATPVSAEVHVYFSLVDDPEQVIIEELNGAEDTIDIAMYYFTDRHITNAVLDAASRGVKVRIYLDKEQREAFYSKSRYLAKRDMPVKYSDNPYIMHNKFAVIDNEVVITGSYNWTASAGARNNENLLVIEDCCIACRYTKEFDRLWFEHCLSEEPDEKGQKPTRTVSFELVAVCFDGNPDGKDEWVVIRNATDRTFNLKGWYVADDLDDGHKFQIKQPVELGPGETVAVMNTESCEITVSYDKLYCLDYNNYWWTNTGDTVRLIDPQGNIVLEEIVENTSNLRKCH